jgi:hypothetical protein
LTDWSGRFVPYARRRFDGALHVAEWRETDFIDGGAYAEEEAEQKQNL